MTLRQAAATVAVANAAARSAAEGTVVAIDQVASLMDVCVVGLGKIGLPLAVQFASKGHRVRRCGHQPERPWTLVNAGHEPFPGEAHLAEQLAGMRSPTGC